VSKSAKKTKRKKQVKSAPASAVAPVAAPPAEGAVSRDNTGKFVAGGKGGPGRPKGSRNMITQERLALEQVLRAYLGDPKQIKKATAAIDRLFSIAATGDDKEAIMAVKVLFDKIMTSPKQEDSSDKQPQVTIILEDRLEGDKARPVEVILDSTATEVK
jgi:hypothetical protein